jgi:uncharacterized membrane protein
MRLNIGSERLIALTDGVIAVIITIMVLELKPPHGADLASLRELGPTFLSFALSFVYVAIYWNNHHHFFRLVPHVGASIMWANLNLLFWLSLIPFATAWTDEHGGAPAPVAVYGAVLLACAVSWRIMQAAIVRAQGSGSPLSAAIRGDIKGGASIVIYTVAIGLAFVAPILAYACYAAAAAWWLIPDRRVEKALPFD